MKIGYGSIYDQIITLEILDDISYFDLVHTANTATHMTRLYNILGVEDLNGNIISRSDAYCEKNSIYSYYKTKERAFNECVRHIYFRDFFASGKVNPDVACTDKYNLSGLLIDYYDDGKKNLDFYHNNGTIDGVLRKYYYHGTIESEEIYVSGNPVSYTLYNRYGEIIENNNM